MNAASQQALSTNGSRPYPVPKGQHPCLTLFKDACLKFGTGDKYEPPIAEGQPDRRCHKLDPEKAGVIGRMEFYASDANSATILIWAEGLAGCKTIQSGIRLDKNNAAFVLTICLTPPSFTCNAQPNEGGTAPPIFAFLVVHGNGIFTTFREEDAN